MPPRLNSPPTEKVGAQENRHTTHRAHPRGTDGSNPAPSSRGSRCEPDFRILRVRDHSSKAERGSLIAPTERQTGAREQPLFRLHDVAREGAEQSTSLVQIEATAGGVIAVTEGFDTPDLEEAKRLLDELE